MQVMLFQLIFCRSLSDEAARSHQRVRELEGYLGGEIPHLPKEKDGNSLTWREEREKLHSIVEVSLYW